MIELPMPVSPIGGFPSHADGCVYSSMRQILGALKVMEKTGSIEQTAKANAEDLATLDSEFFKLRAIIPYSYEVRENGIWVNGGRTLEDINDPDGIDGGRIRRVVKVQNTMAKDLDLIQAAVPSEDFGSGRNYLYFFSRDSNDRKRINALAIEHQGNKNEFRNLLKALTPDNDNPSFDRPLFFNSGNQVSINDVFRAVLDSYQDPVRKEEMKPYLTRLARDAADFPGLLKEHQQAVDTLTEKFQKEIISNENVVAGISAVVQGINRTVESWIEKDRQGYLQRIGGSIIDTPVHVSEAWQELGEKIIMSVVPGYLGMINIMASISEENGEEKNEIETNQEEAKGITAINQKEEEQPEEQVLWEKIIAVILSSMSDKGIEGTEEEFIEENGERNGFTFSSQNGTFLNSTDVDLSSLEKTFDKERMINCFQTVLKVLSTSGKEDSLKEPVSGQALEVLQMEEATKVIVDLARSIVDTSQLDSLSLLINVYDSLGKDEEIEIRVLLTALIYHQIEKLNEDPSFEKIDDISSVFTSIEVYRDVFIKRLMILKDRLIQFIGLPSGESQEKEWDPLFILYSVIFIFLDIPWMQISPQIKKNQRADTTPEFIPKTVLMELGPSGVLGRQQQDIGWLVERLVALRNRFFLKKISKKRGKKLPAETIVFFYQVVYQHQDTCYQSWKMTQ